MNLLFSNQSHLNYITEELKGENFEQLIINNKINKDSFHDFQQMNINFLIENGIISVNNYGVIFTTKKSCLIQLTLCQFHKNQVWQHCSQKI